MVRQGSCLFGVRFGSLTHYCLLDIDVGSAYHPQRDRLAISRILNALEPLGLVSYIACTSSDSGGIHLYFPFESAQNSWELAVAVTTLLENVGLRVTPGQLEVFPNPKLYAVESRPSLFNAHRLPLQAGSWLLNADFQPIWGDRSSFVQHWRFAQSRNDLSTVSLRQILKQVKRKPYRVSGRAEKFINDLNAEIEAGWTGSGQTNRLLGRIAMRAYVFHHVLFGGEPLSGQALVDEIVAIAQSLPGYKECCCHQHEIEERAAEWARCVENSRYFHYGSRYGKCETPQLTEPVTEQPTWNQRQSEATREKIRQAIGHLLETNALPTTTTARFQALTGFGIGGSSLYRHRDLWHPSYLVESVEPPPNPPHFI
ncbi:MAG: hypothetical protein HC769_03970 [Cyanobacteria bacterium CRU_2_1]|nr:hypothetical protein [Cyanobacteria bacterium CRU_2_1]